VVTGDGSMVSVLTQVYERSRRQLRAVAARYVGDEAEDVVHDAFLSALRSSATYRGDAAPLTWLHRIVVNASVSRCRKRKRQVLADPGPGSHPVMTDAGIESALAIRMALRQLTADQHRVFVLYEVVGHTHGEIAARLAIPTATSKSRLAEARRRLQQLLGGGRAVRPRRLMDPNLSGPACV